MALSFAEIKSLEEFVGNLNSLSKDTSVYLDVTTGHLTYKTIVLGTLVSNVDGKTYDVINTDDAA